MKSTAVLSSTRAADADVVRPQPTATKSLALRLNVETVLRGVNLLEKLGSHGEALHYLRIVIPKCPTNKQWRAAAARIAMILDRGLGSKTRALAAYYAALKG